MIGRVNIDFHPMRFCAVQVPIKVHGFGAFTVKGHRFQVGSESIAAFPFVGYFTSSACSDISFD
jgi:hypothetical protein